MREEEGGVGEVCKIDNTCSADGCMMLLSIYIISITYSVIFLWVELSEITSCHFVAYYALSLVHNLFYDQITVA